MTTTLNNKDLMDRLVSVQNHPFNASRDIMSRHVRGLSLITSGLTPTASSTCRAT